jgi:thiol-disulfide isomerase/thioredoxin
MSFLSGGTSVFSSPVPPAFTGGAKRGYGGKSSKGGKGVGRGGKGAKGGKRKLRGGGDCDAGIITVTIIFIVILLMIIIGAACWNTNYNNNGVSDVVVDFINCPNAAPVTLPAVATSLAPKSLMQRMETAKAAVVQDLQSEDEARRLLGGSNDAMLFIYMDGCGFCHKALPVFQELAANFGNVKLAKLNAKNAAGLIQENELDGFPTFLTNFGQQRKHVGFKPKPSMERILQGAARGANARIVVSPVSPVAPPANNAGRGGGSGGKGAVEVTEQEALAELANDKSVQKTILFIYADWCGFCKKMKPVYTELATDPKYHQYKLMMINADKAPNIVKNNQITGYPSFLRNFGPDKKKAGYQNKLQFAQLLDQH